MISTTFTSRLACALLITLLSSSGSLPADERPRPANSPSTGAVVLESVDRGSALEHAGLRAGDLLLSWESAPSSADARPAQGAFESVFDWRRFLVEQAPRGPILIHGRRHGQAHVFRVEPGRWEGAVRPSLPAGLQAEYERGRTLREAGQLAEATRVWTTLARDVEASLGWRAASGLLLRIGDVWRHARDWERAEGSYRAALERARTGGARSEVWKAIGQLLEEQSLFEPADSAYRASWDTLQQTTFSALESADRLHHLGELARRRERLDAASDHLERALEIRQREVPQSLAVADTTNSIGAVELARGNLDQAQLHLERALALRQKLAPNGLDVAASWINLGALSKVRRNLSEGAEYFERARSICQELAPGGILDAKSRSNLGTMSLLRGQLDEAEAYLLPALAIFEDLSPRGREIAAALNNLAILSQQRGDLEGAGRYYERTLTLFRELAPESASVARTLNNMGVVAWESGDLKRAAQLFERAAAIQERLGGASILLAVGLNNLGMLAHARGDAVRALHFLHQGHEMLEKLVPGSLDLSANLTNLGNVAAYRGDVDQGFDYHHRALQIRRDVAPRSFYVAQSLSNLGNMEVLRQRLDQATDYFEQALEIWDRSDPENPNISACLNNLAFVAFERGEADQAAVYLERNRAIYESLAPESLNAAVSLAFFGKLAWVRGNLDEADRYYRQALSIQTELTPRSLQVAESWSGLGRVAAARGDGELASKYFAKSMESLEFQAERLGATADVKGHFLARHRHLYQQAIEAHLELDQIEQAFEALEKSRARGFLDLLAERDLIFSADIPQKLESQRRRVGAEQDRLHRKLAGLSLKKDAEEIRELHDDLRRVHREREAVVEEIRETSPQLADLRYTEALGFEDARQSLDPGTVMLSYSVGETATHLFVVARGGELRVEEIQVSESELRLAVREMRSLVPQALPGEESGAEHNLTVLGRRLHEWLILPAADVIAAGERILVVPDGPLHILPWGALVRESNEYLAEWKPLHLTLSATVDSQIRNRRPQAADPAQLYLTAFGDPRYPEAPGDSDRGGFPGDRYVRDAADRGFAFSALPYTRGEIRRIASLYPAERVATYLGAEATEEAAKGVGDQVRILHLATHGHLDDLFPLDSAVVLTIPETLGEQRDNGLLQVWEIFEQVRLDADLVVLSACASALGREDGGEGLIGLTRAFQYAGARSVLASLWSVNDQATAELMVRFYRHLQAGKTKDEALRAAQLELIRGPIELTGDDGKTVTRDRSAPYYWAAFQLYGDWR